MRDGDTVVGLAPLFRSRVGSGPLASTVLQRLNPDAGDYGGMLLGPPAIGFMADWFSLSTALTSVAALAATAAAIGAATRRA